MNWPMKMQEILSKIKVNITWDLTVQDNGYKIYVDIITGENCRQFRLLTWTSLIGQFVYPVWGEGCGKGGG